VYTRICSGSHDHLPQAHPASVPQVFECIPHSTLSTLAQSYQDRHCKFECHRCSMIPQAHAGSVLKCSNAFTTRHFPHYHDCHCRFECRHCSKTPQSPQLSARVFKMHSPLDTSHTRTVLSSLPLQIRVPSLLHDTAFTTSECASV